MPDLLIRGGITDAMRAALEPHFTLVRDASAAVEYALVGGHIGLDAPAMEAMPNLKAISNYGVGYDGVDAVGAAQRGIVVTHTPNVLNGEVANTTLLLLLACYRELLRDDAWARSGQWEAEGEAPLTRSPDGARIGFLGMGRIGQEIARRLAIFDPEISYHTRSPKDVPYRYEGDLVEMARNVDCLIVITPGGPATKHLVDRAVLEALGPQGTLINVARGSVVDEVALVACLAEGSLGWAGLDVFEHEPKVPDALKTMPNVVMLPHAGSATRETRAAMGQLAADNLIDHLKHGTVRTPVPECAHLAG
ncbi:MAG: 2-hydroxyacid dehydrogenase [Pseudomonadota bacterium]